MGMTLTQKILAAHAGLAEVKAGQLINAKLDIVLGNDITTPVAINEFEKAGFDGVFDKEHIAIVLDHFVPNKDIKSATQSKQIAHSPISHAHLIAWKIYRPPTIACKLLIKRRKTLRGNKLLLLFLMYICPMISTII